MRGIALLTSLAFLLAGCSDGDGGGDAPLPSASLSTSTAPPAPPVPTTDTLHLLQGPDMTTVPPTGSDSRTPVGFGDGGPDGNQAPGATWSHQVTRGANVTAGEVRIWIEVKEQMFDFPGTPVREQCNWRLTTALGGDNQALVNCVNEPVGPINPVVKELVFTLVLPEPVNLEAGETVTLTLTRSGFSASANNAVDALSGSPDHDSRIALRGLAEPVEA